MSQFDAEQYFANLKLQQSGALDSATAEAVVNASVPPSKEEQLARKSALKQQALTALKDRAQLRNQLRDSLTGRVLQAVTKDDDVALTAVGAVQKAAGSLTGGAGDLVDLGREALGNQPIFGNYFLDKESGFNQGVDEVTDTLQAGEEYLTEAGRETQLMRTGGSEEMQRRAMPSGDLFDPETWAMGEDPNLYGAMLGGADVAGQVVPQLAGALTKAPKLVGAVTGGLQAAGSQATEAEQYIDSLDHGGLLQASTDYRRLIALGVDPEKAREEIRGDASRAAAVMGAVVGGAGGAVTSKLFAPTADMLERNVAGRIGRAALLETGTEGLEEAGETMAAREATNVAIGGDRNISEDTFGDFVMGAMGGAAISGPGTVLREGGLAVQAGAGAAATALEKRGESKELKAATDAAAETGDVAPLLDRKAKTYSPTRAVDALLKYGNRDGATEEDKQTTLTKIDEVVTQLRNDLTKAQTIEDYTSPTYLDDRKAEREDLAKQRAALGDTPSDAATQLDEQIAAVDAEIASYKPVSADARKRAVERRTQLEEELTQAETKRSQMTQHTAPVEVDPTPDLDLLDQTPDPADTAAVEQTRQAADRVLTLAIQSPSKLKTEHLDRLINNTTLPITTEQRDYLRTLHESRVAENEAKDMAQVSQEVLRGSPENRYVGLKNYFDQFEAAIQPSGSQQRADNVVGRLSKFVKAHAAKAEAVGAAFDKAVETGSSVFVAKGKDGTWAEIPPLSKEEVSQGLAKKLGALEIHRNSPVVRAIQIEANALQTGLAAMQKNYNLRFKANKPVSPVTVSPGAAPAAATPSSRAAAPATRTLSPTPARQKPAPAMPTTAADIDARADVLRQERHKLSTQIAQINDTMEKATSPAARTRLQQKRTELFRRHDAMGVELQQLGNAKRALQPEGEKPAAPAARKPAVQVVDETDVRTEEDAANAQDDRAFNYETGEWVTDEELAGDATAGAESEAATEETAAEVRTDVATEETDEAGENSEAAEEAQPTTGKLSLFERAARWSKEQWDAALAAHQQDPANNLHPYRRMNLVSQFFKQTPGKTDTGSPRPLVSVANFRSQIQNRVKQVADFYKPRDTNSDEQSALEQAALGKFFKIAERWQPAIEQLLVKLGEDRAGFNYENPLQFFINPDETADPIELKDRQGNTRTVYRGKVDENLATAVSFAVVSWVAEQATNPTLNEKQINQQLGRDEDAHVDERTYAALAAIGPLENFVAANLGQRIAQALGLKPTKDAPANEEAKLHAALGSLAIRLGIEQGVIERTELFSNDLAIMKDPANYEPILAQEEAARQKWLAANPKKKPDQYVRQGEKTGFIRVAREKPDNDNARVGPLTMKSQFLRDTLKGSRDVLGRVFGAETEDRGPHLDARGFSAKKVRRTQQDVPSTLAKALDRQGNEPNGIIPNMLEVYDGLPRTLQEKLAGVLEEDTRVLHKVNRDSQQAKNEALRRGLDQFEDWAATLDRDRRLYDPFYFDFFVGKPQRTFVDSTTINRQTNKQHRYLIGLIPEGQDAPVTEVVLDDDVSEANFKLRVGEGFGVKTDKKNKLDSLAQVNKLLEDPDVVKAVNGLKAWLSSSTEQAEIDGATQVAIENLYKAYKPEGFHMLMSLVSLAEYGLAKDAGESSFTTALFGEIDGVTNGPMITQLLLGTASAETLQRGGFFRAGDNVKDFPTWKGDSGLRDLYEWVFDLAHNALEARRTDSSSKRSFYVNIAAEAANYLVGGFIKNGRNLVKQPLTSMMFGAGVNGVIDNMGLAFAETYYTQIERIYNDVDPKEQRAELKELIRNMNILIRHGNAQMKYLGEKYGVKYVQAEELPANLPMKDYLRAELDSETYAALKAAFKDTFGQGVKDALQNGFKLFLHRRTVFNQAANLAFLAYNAAYETARDAMIDRLVASGEMAVKRNKAGEVELEDGRPIPLHDLTLAQLKEVEASVSHLKPVLQTHMSLESENPNAGLLLAGSDREMAKTDMYRVDTKFLNPDNKTTGVSGRAVGALRDTLTEPGVAALILSVHSTDSAIGSASYAKLQALNIHDGFGISLDDMIKMGVELNKNTFEVLLNYSPSIEMMNTLQSSLMGLHAQTLVRQNRELLVERVTAAAKAFYRRLDEDSQEALSGGGSGLLSYMAQTMAINALQSEIGKLEQMKEMAYVNQYALVDGAYAVTDADRARAAELQAKYEAELAQGPLTPAFRQALDELDALIGDIPSQVLQEDQRKKDQNAELRARRMEAREATPKANAASQERMAKLGPKGISRHNQSVWLNFFETAARRNKPVAAKDVLAEAQRQVKQRLAKTPEDPLANFEARLVSMLQRAMPANLQTFFVQPATDLSAPGFAELDWDDRSQDAAFYQMTEAGGRIVYKGQGFTSSALTTETVLHELAHASLAPLIEAAKAPGHPLHALYQELEALRQAALKHVATDPALSERHAPALSSIQEFVAYGMTNKALQQEVLAEISVPSTRTPTAKESGLKAFVEKLVGFLRQTLDPKKIAQDTQGLTLFLNNVTTLFAEAAESQVTNAPSMTLAARSPANQPLTTEELFQALGSVSGTVLPVQYENRLRELVENIVDRVRRPFEAYNAEKDLNPPMDPVDRYLHTLVTGNRPFVSPALAAGFKLAPQTAFVLEQVEAVLSITTRNTGTETKTHAIYKDLSRIFEEARERLTPEHFHRAFTGQGWSTASAQERQVAQDQWDFVFNRLDRAADGTTNAVTRFAALVLTVPEFDTLVAHPTYRTTKAWTDLNIWERVQRAFHALLDYLGGTRAIGYFGQPANSQARQLIDALVDVENRNRRRLAQRPNVLSEKLESGSSALRDAVIQGLGKFGRSSRIQNSAYAPVRFTGKVAAMAADDRLAEYYETLQHFRNRLLKSRPGVVMGVLNEIRNVPAAVLHHIQQAKVNEQQRKQLKDGTVRWLRDSFANHGKDLTPAMYKTITTVGLRTDLSALLERFSLAQIQELVLNDTARATTIRDLENQIPSANRAFYLGQAKDLAYHMMTGKTATPLLHQNTYVMARAWGHPLQRTITETEAQAVEQPLNELVTLYALSHINVVERSTFSQLLASENQRTDGNGIEATLKLHRQLQRDSKERLFRESEALMVKGYLPELYAPHVEVTYATAAKGMQLEEEGWVRVHGMPRDPHDPDQEPRALYALYDRGHRQLLTGAITYTGRRSRGTKAHGGMYDPISGGTHFKNANTHRNLLASKATEIADLANRPLNYSPETGSHTKHLAPVFNAEGELVNFRYLMWNQTKDQVLERDNDFSKLLGSFAGSIVDKESAPAQNRTVLEALHEQHREEFAKNPDSFLEISATSKDPALRELWRLLPKESQDDAEALSGQPKIFVRADLLDPLFGYRKHSLAAMFDKLPRQAGIKSPNMRNIAEEIFVTVLEHFFGAKAALRIRQAENIWQEMVRVTKDILVVKTGLTLVGNVISNIGQLWWAGVPVKDIIRHGQVALKEAIIYRSEHAQLQALIQKRDSGYIQGPAAELDRQIALLEDSLARNPTRELIEAGLLPTIVEDVTLEDEADTHVSRLQQRLQPYTDRVPGSLRTVARYAFVTHDTPLYKVLSQGTQLSDFVARYTLYQHLTTRKNNPMSREDAITRASNDFVNYDVPSHPMIQYLNDMGLLMFTKYYLRIQRTILNQWAENPGRGLALLLAGNYFDGVQTIMDSTLSLGNPFQFAPETLLEAADETLPINTLLSVWK